MDKHTISSRAQLAERLAGALNDEQFVEAFFDVLYAEMQSDNERPDKKVRELFRQYVAGTDEVRETVDNLLMTLCGWSLGTLFDKAVEAKQKNHEEDVG